VILISVGQNSGKEDPALAQAAPTWPSHREDREGKLRNLCAGEKNNAQGALDMGVAPSLLPGYADLRDPAARSRFEKAWKLTLPDQEGMGALAILQGIEEGRIKGLYLAGENPWLPTRTRPGRRKPWPPWISWSSRIVF